MSRSTNNEGNTSSEEDRRNTSDNSRSSGEKETLEKGLNPPSKGGKFNAFKKQREELVRDIENQTEFDIGDSAF